MTKADGTELASINVTSDYSFKGEFKETPKDGDKLIVKYGGKVYDITYTLDAAKVGGQTNSSTTQSGSQSGSGQNSQTNNNVNAKSGLLPSTGQRNPLGMTIAGLSLMIAGVVALFMKFRKKESAE